MFAILQTMPDGRQFFEDINGRFVFDSQVAAGRAAEIIADARVQTITVQVVELKVVYTPESGEVR